MIFVADEGVDAQVIATLRRSGHDVTFVAELAPGLVDGDVLGVAAGRDAVLITADKDFGDLVVRQRRPVAGVVLLRLAGLPSEEKAALVEKVVASHTPQLAGSFAVITRRTVRFRRIT